MQRYRLEMKPRPLFCRWFLVRRQGSPTWTISTKTATDKNGLIMGWHWHAALQNKPYESVWLTLPQLLANQRRLTHPRGGGGGGLAAASPQRASYPPTVTSQNVSFLRGSTGEEAVRAEQLSAKCADAVLVAHPPPKTLKDHCRCVVQRAQERWVD